MNSLPTKPTPTTATLIEFLGAVDAEAIARRWMVGV